MTDHPWLKEVINLVHKRLSPPWEEHAQVTIIKPCLSRLVEKFQQRKGPAGSCILQMERTCALNTRESSRKGKSILSRRRQSNQPPPRAGQD